LGVVSSGTAVTPIGGGPIDQPPKQGGSKSYWGGVPEEGTDSANSVKAALKSKSPRPMNEGA